MPDLLAEARRYVIGSTDRELLDVVFRPAGTADAPQLHDLSSPFTVTGALVQRDSGFYAQRVQDFYVLEVRGRIVAAAALRRFPRTVEVLNVCVAGDWHGLGLGGLLMRAMLDVARAEGYDEMFLFSKMATGWFTRFGFVPVSPAELPPERLLDLDPQRRSVPLVLRPLSSPPPAPAGSPSVEFARSKVTCEWGQQESLLELAEDHGVEVESLCQGGICGTCRSPLLRGSVSYDLVPETEVGPGEVLLCISRPATDVVLDV